jgi:hypothetical protein
MIFTGLVMKKAENAFVFLRWAMSAPGIAATALSVMLWRAAREMAILPLWE